jgi:hypothetical protein
LGFFRIFRVSSLVSRNFIIFTTICRLFKIENSEEKQICKKIILLLTFLSLMASCACISGLAEPASKFQRASGIVAVLTDFGTEDYYVGALEGSIYSADPTVRISTISHQVKPFDITEGSYILAKAIRWYPTGTVFVGDVDPGSTRDRRFIVMTTLDTKLFVGPDNGLFTEVIHDFWDWPMLIRLQTKAS